MHVKKLVMNGFKSFPRKTEIPFTEGINVILGISLILYSAAKRRCKLETSCNYSYIKWKGVKYNVLKKPNQRIELFNLELDPSEENNLASQYPEIVEELTKLMQEARTPSDIFQFAAPTYLNVD